MRNWFRHQGFKSVETKVPGIAESEEENTIFTLPGQLKVDIECQNVELRKCIMWSKETK